MGRRKMPRPSRPDEIKVGDLVLTEISDNCGGWTVGGFSPEYDYSLFPGENESPTDDEWRLFFSPYCCHDKEEWYIKGIQKYLQTEAQKKALFDMNLSISDLRMSRYGGYHRQVCEIFSDWNQKLGFQCFKG
jgi:hypothetical protein